MVRLEIIPESIAVVEDDGGCASLEIGTKGWSQFMSDEPNLT